MLVVNENLARNMNDGVYVYKKTILAKVSRVALIQLIDLIKKYIINYFLKTNV